MPMSAELQALIDRLTRPLEVEEKTGCRNFAVIGGFDRYMVTWATRAAQLCDGDLRQHLQALAQLFADYAALDPSERRRRILSAKTLLAHIRRRVTDDGGQEARGEGTRSDVPEGEQKEGQGMGEQGKGLLAPPSAFRPSPVAGERQQARPARPAFKPTPQPAVPDACQQIHAIGVG